MYQQNAQDGGEISLLLSHHRLHRLCSLRYRPN